MKDKTKLAPENLKANREKTDVEKYREMKKCSRKDTARFKATYFDKYDDIKINHREDW